METTADTFAPLLGREPKKPRPAPGPVFIGDILNAPLGQPDLVRLWVKDWQRLNDDP